MYKKISLIIFSICFVILSIFVYRYVNNKVYKVDIPTYSQHEFGYPKGCEGVSLYMALKGKGYMSDYDLDSFMETMPIVSDNPNLGYVGNPRLDGKAKENLNKRTTIYPEPLAKWGSQFGKVVDMSGKSTDELKKEILKGNPIIVYVTGGWKKPTWKQYSWGTSVTSNHALCLVGYSSNGNYLVNDCGTSLGEYWVKKEKFESIYNSRKFAVVVK